MGNHEMERKGKILLKVSWNIGLIAFVGGWMIFLTWLGGRYLNASDFDNLEIIGFFWMIAFFWLSLIGLVLLLTYVIINRMNLHAKMLFTALIILINIPSVLIILSVQGDIENKVFVKLTNESNLTNIQLKLNGKLKTWNIGSLDEGSSLVFNYDPPYWNYDARLYQKPDTLNLIIIHDKMTDTVGFPTLYMGSCISLVLDDKLNLKSP